MTNKPSANLAQTRLSDTEETIIIRPLRHSDLMLEEEFFEDLSFNRKRNRFLGGVASISADELDQLCDLDYHDSMAFLALRDNGKYSVNLGMARYALDKAKIAHELAIVIADEVDAMNLGTKLLTHLFDYARKNEVKRLYCIEFRDNKEMKLLAEKMGMSREIDPDDIHQLKYVIEL